MYSKEETQKLKQEFWIAFAPADQFQYLSDTANVTIVPTSVGGGSIVPGSTAFDIADGTFEFRNMNGTWDLSLFKTFSVTERVKVTFRAEALNAINHPYFRAPGTNVDSSSFGKITSQANFPRFVQLGFRAAF